LLYFANHSSRSVSRDSQSTRPRPPHFIMSFRMKDLSWATCTWPLAFETDQPSAKCAVDVHPF
jgi:hypothetical protein